MAPVRNKDRNGYLALVYAQMVGDLQYPQARDGSIMNANGFLDVIAWHPDSDFGPTDQDHPMINRTLR